MEELEMPTEIESRQDPDYDSMQEHVIDGDHELHFIDALLTEFGTAKREKEAVSQ